MSDMIERVARAICESEKMNPDDALGGWVHWTDAARAAIEAMRDLPEEPGSGYSAGYYSRSNIEAFVTDALVSEEQHEQ